MIAPQIETFSGQFKKEVVSFVKIDVDEVQVGSFTEFNPDA